jgi:predicted amidohydrolase YtcJ
MALDKADLVLHEGAVCGHPGSDSVAVGDGLILAHGRFADLKPLVGPRTHLVRLGGRVVAPGFVDCHQHFMEGAASSAGLSVTRCRTIADLLSDLRVAAGRTPPGNWLRVFGCDEALMRERRGPTREELDRAAPKNPLRLRHQTLHGSWLNSRAITALGLEKPGFVPPAGAILVGDANGRLSGLVVGMEEWIGARMPRVTAAELEARSRAYSRELAGAGITAFTDATVRNGPEDMAVFARLSASGAIAQRVSMMLGPVHIGQSAQLRVAAERSGIAIAGIKFTDVARWDTGPLVRAVADAMAHEMDCAFHCTEVEELDAALTAIEFARERVAAKSIESIACRIEHGGMIPPEYPERIAALGAWVVSNPGFVYYRGVKYAGEPGLIPYLYRAKSLLDAGIDMAGGSDAPVTPARPLTAIAAAMTRISIEGYELALSERIESPRAFAMFTASAARLCRLNAGEIAPGRLADLIVLPSDPTALKPADLINLPVDITIVGGRMVYERGRPLVAQSAGMGMYS